MKAGPVLRLDDVQRGRHAVNFRFALAELRFSTTYWYESVDLDALLAAARTGGEIRRFSFEPPKLSELFMEAVAESDAAEPLQAEVA